ncbi:MAG TPA: BON domain-containing protein [Nitrospiraceae bacterium]|nr:BON domain-containing protein [Nitrospiraceae bacterium]
MTCWMCLVVLPAIADEPNTKPQDTKPPQAKPQESPKQPESKPSETKGQDAKTPAPPTPPVKASESKPPEAKAPEAKAPESKGQDTKASESKVPDAPPVKTPETKAPETKAQDAKTAAPPTPAPKAPEAKAPDSKPADTPKIAGMPILAIKLALMADPRLFPYEINVDMNGDVAVLTGKVGTEADKAAAADIVQGLEGVKSITNNLEVAKDLPQTLARKKDDIITQYVKERFGKSKTLETAHFDIKTEDGIVSLSGKTKFLVIALEAAEAARNVPGVKAVKSEGIRVEAGE